MAAVQGRTQQVDSISPRLDRLPATRSVWKLIMLLSLGFFFELYDLLLTGYVAPGLVKSGILTPTTQGLFGTSGVASFMAALFAGLFIGTIGCGFLADRFGRRTIFTWSLLWYTAANLIMAFQTDAFGVNLWRFIAGLGTCVGQIVTLDPRSANRSNPHAGHQSDGAVNAMAAPMLGSVPLPTK